MQHEIINRLSLVRLLPGDPTLPSCTEMLWGMLKAEGKLDIFFPSCDGSWSHERWAEQLRRDGCHLLVCCEKGDGTTCNRVLGFILLAGIRPRRAFFHFSWFSAIGLQIVEASKWVCNRTLQIYDLDVLIGMIPEINGKAIKLAEATGFEFCGFLPFGSYVHRLGHSVLTQIYCYTNLRPGAINGGDRAMRIYNSITIDMETGAVIEADAYEYEGPLALCDGGPGGAGGGPEGSGMASGEEGSGMATGEEGSGIAPASEGSGMAPGEEGSGMATATPSVSISSVLSAVAKGAALGFGKGGLPGALAGAAIGAIGSVASQGGFSGLGSEGAGNPSADGGGAGGNETPAVPGYKMPIQKPAEAPPVATQEPVLGSPVEITPTATVPNVKAEQQRKAIRQKMGYWSTRKTSGPSGPLNIFTPSLFEM